MPAGHPETCAQAGYGTSGKYKLSDYRFNQINRQLILGSALDANDANYKPSWSQRSSWAIEAHYFWENGKTSSPYAQTGKVIGVNPGDHLITIIRFDPKAGTIVASIEDEDIPEAGLSAITIVRPFPNEPSLFKSWTDFFQKATAASRSPMSTPQHSSMWRPIIWISKLCVDCCRSRSQK
jgi:hypothetical protein